MGHPVSSTWGRGCQLIPDSTRAHMEVFGRRDRCEFGVGALGYEPAPHRPSKYRILLTNFAGERLQCNFKFSTVVARLQGLTFCGGATPAHVDDQCRWGSSMYNFRVKAVIKYCPRPQYNMRAWRGPWWPSPVPAAIGRVLCCRTYGRSLIPIFIYRALNLDSFVSTRCFDLRDEANYLLSDI
jgi:hypothetical protein